MMTAFNVFSHDLPDNMYRFPPIGSGGTESLH